MKTYYTRGSNDDIAAIKRDLVAGETIEVHSTYETFYGLDFDKELMQDLRGLYAEVKIIEWDHREDIPRILLVTPKTPSIAEWTKDQLRSEWIEAGLPCGYRHGWRWKGAPLRELSPDEALALLPRYNPGTGFYELGFIKCGDKAYLEFNELSESDMD